jgi:hypothetical protein
MWQTLGFVCCAVLVFHATPPADEQASGSESTVTVTATIEAIDKTSRTITLKRPQGSSVEIKAPEQMEGFNSLRVGDQVTATYFEALALHVRKPGDPVPSAEPATVTERN